MRLLLVAITLGLASPTAAQQPTPIKLGPSKPYRHKPSGLSIASTLDGLQRTLASAYVPELDEALGFDEPTNSETLSVFVFRNVIGSVPLWFDRVERVASLRDSYGGLTPSHTPSAFAPAGEGVASGLINTYAVAKGPYRSTGIAFMPIGSGWYVSVRYSSKTLEPATLETHLRAVTAALGWPRKTEPQPAAVPIADCTTPLATSGAAKPLARSKALGSALLFGALLSSADNATRRKLPKDGALAGTVPWCRDLAASAALGTSGVYRPVGTNDRFLIAYQDAGRGLMVEPDTLSILLDKDAVPSWSITEFDVGAATGFVPRDRLPAPDAARAIVSKEGYASKTATWGGKRNVQIGSGMLN